MANHPARMMMNLFSDGPKQLLYAWYNNNLLLNKYSFNGWETFKTLIWRWGCNYVSGIWIPPPICLWLTIYCQISANQHEAETSANVNKHWKTRAKGNYAITNIISANQHFHRLFWCRYSNSRDLVASSPSFSCPATRVLQRACSWA